MQKLYRNIFAAGVITLGLAACGDDVTVTPPPAPPTPGVTSVTVTPNAQTINVGQEVVFAAAVIADAGVTNTSVTWSSSNATIASVEAATGKVKGLVPGSTTIIAKSNLDNSRQGASVVTVVALPPGVTSFNASPSAISLIVGGTQTGNINAVYAAGVTAPAITWSSLNTSVATVNPTTGVITAVAPGAAVVRASATLAADPSRGTPAQTVTADINVTVLAAPSISIQSVTQTTTATPVDISNVMGQIEVTLNFNPREQPMDSVVVSIDQPGGVTKTAAKQTFSGAIPAAGPLVLSIQTDNYTKNATAGTTAVSFVNGQTTIRAAVWRTNPNGGASVPGGNALNCSVAPNFPICAAPISLVLNNADGWAADITKPTRSAQSAGGITYWGGPAAAGQVTATLYSVIYTSGREISQVNWTLGTASTFNTCANSPELTPGTPAVSNTRPWKRTFGYAATGVLACTGHEWNGGGAGDRDNVIVFNALDNSSNPYIGTLIPNATIFGSTPDSLRLDYVGPSVNTPSIVRAAPAVTGWVNAGFSFINFASSDAGIGLNATRDRAVVYNVVKCPAAGTQGVAMPSGTGTDIPECATNFIGGAVGLGGTAPYTVNGTESDRLTNVGTSAATATFGVDKTNPGIRAGIVQAAPALVLAISADTTTFAAKPVAGTNVWRAEYLDERSGFSATAQRHSIAVGSHIFSTGSCIVGTGPVGASFVTAPTCGMATATPGILRLDGWQTGQQVDVPLPEQYAAYTTNVTDAAGNVSSNLFSKTLVNALAPFATGLGIPAQLTSANFGFLSTGADSAEASSLALQVTYPSLAGTAVGATDSVRYNRTSLSTRFDNAIFSPFSTTITPTTGAPYAHSIELVDATAFPGSNTTAGVQAKPTKVQTFTFNFGGFNTASTEIAIPALNVESNATIAAFNAANPTVAVNHWRIITTVATSNQFGSTVPLRAQAVAPTNSPNPPFTRVDFYRVVAGYYSYLGSVSSATVQNSTACTNSLSQVCGTDQGTYRSWVYQLPSANYVARWDGVTQAGVASTNLIIAVGVLSTGDAISTLQATMVP